MSDELREQIAKEIRQAILNYYTCRMTMEKAGEYHSDRILAIIKEAGYKSPEECTKCFVDKYGKYADKKQDW